MLWLVDLFALFGGETKDPQACSAQEVMILRSSDPRSLTDEWKREDVSVVSTNVNRGGQVTWITRARGIHVVIVGQWRLHKLWQHNRGNYTTPTIYQKKKQKKT